MLKKITITLISLAAISLNSIAQETELPNSEKLNRYYFMIGWNQPDIDKLNMRLTDKGYTPFADNFISAGGGYHSMTNRIVIGCEGNLLFSEEKKSNIDGNAYTSSVVLGYGFFNVGYSVISDENLNIYPIIGAGIGGMWLNIGQTNFDDLLDNPKGNAEHSYGSFLLNLALGTDYYWKLKEDEDGESGFVLGLRLGYTFEPFGGEWTDISGGPEVRISGPYIRLSVGGGGKSYQ